MHHSQNVGMLKAESSLANELTSLADWQWSLFADERRQRRPVNVLENQKETLADVVRIECGDDVWVHEPRCRPYFPLKHDPSLVGARQLSGEHLERDDAIHRAVLGFENAAHAAPANFIENAILSENKSVRPAGKQVFGLKSSQHAFLDKEPR
jgi:hypothetical protein